jgi:hypothetical protein
MPSIAELVCQSCRSVTYTVLPGQRIDTMPTCRCGGQRQVVRVMADRRRTEREVPRERRDEED